MPIKAVTFDCAGTLISVDWSPARFAVASAEAAGLSLPQDAAGIYRALYVERLDAFLEANRSRSADSLDRFYRELTCRWLGQLGLGTQCVEAVMAAADRLAFGPESILFGRYEDSLDSVRHAKAAGLKVAVLSNWDITLHRVLSRYEISPWVDFALASLEEGVEKPEPRFFEMALERLDVQPCEALHVGDNPVDDVEGARKAGWHACLLDRSRSAALPGRIDSLRQVMEVVASLG